MLPLILGTLGMVCLLLAFILDELNTPYNQDTLLHNLLSIIGAALLVYYALTLKGWPFFVLNAVWLSVALFKLSRITGRTRKFHKII